MAVLSAQIERAKTRTGWSETKIAKAIGIHPNTLLRWKSEHCRSYDLDAIVNLFSLAGGSMDMAFGVESDERPGWAEGLQERLEQLEQRVSAGEPDLVTQLLGEGAETLTPDAISSMLGDKQLERLQALLRSSPARKDDDTRKAG